MRDVSPASKPPMWVKLVVCACSYGRRVVPGTSSHSKSKPAVVRLLHRSSTEAAAHPYRTSLEEGLYFRRSSCKKYVEGARTAERQVWCRDEQKKKRAMHPQLRTSDDEPYRRDNPRETEVRGTFHHECGLQFVWWNAASDQPSGLWTPMLCLVRTSTRHTTHYCSGTETTLRRRVTLSIR